MTNELQDELMSPSTRRKTFTIPQLLTRKRTSHKIVMVTAYDYSSALLAERAEIDIVLVGDSLGMMAAGHKDVLPVTMDEMVYHVRMVKRGLKRSLLLADMPFGSYQISDELGISNAIRLLKEGGASAIKLEGDSETAPLIKKIVHAGVPVVAHIGVTPQSVNLQGGYPVQGRDEESRSRLLSSAEKMVEAGACAVLLEKIDPSVAIHITQSIAVPTIGIGSGSGCDGQVLVWHDLLGLPPGKTYPHVKEYANIGQQIVEALNQYKTEVVSGIFPPQEQQIN